MFKSSLESTRAGSFAPSLQTPHSRRSDLAQVQKRCHERDLLPLELVWRERFARGVMPEPEHWYQALRNADELSPTVRQRCVMRASDHALLQGALLLCDQLCVAILKAPHEEELFVDAALGFLTVTHTAKQHLPHYQPLRAALSARIAQLAPGEDPELLLRGL